MSDSCKRILLHLDAGRRITQPARCARRLAWELGAELVALNVSRPTLVTLPVPGDLGPVTAAALLELDQERRRFVHDTFVAAMADPGPVARYGELCELPMAQAFARQALFADLLVLDQHDPGADAAEAPADFNESVLAASGRPALILPAGREVTPVFDTVAIAWKPTREAARAVAGAMPLLRRASRVDVIAWGRPEAPVRPLDLDGWLKLHGIDARWDRRDEEPPDLGARLMARASELGAGLLVMGCYGHGRAREWVLGGVSRAVLRGMPLPVLMAH